VNLEEVPILPRGVRCHYDDVRQTNLLLGPERVVMLSPVEFEILSRINGKRSIQDISTDLATIFSACYQTIQDDVYRYLSDLNDKRLVDFLSD